MVNLYPKFHDISAVDEGADTLAHGLLKVAAKDGSMSSGVPASRIPKARVTAALRELVRKGAIAKAGKVPALRSSSPAQLEKRFLIRKMAEMFSKEASIDPGALLAAGDKHGPGLILSLIRNKVLLDPREFTAAFLGAQGKRKQGLLIIKKQVMIPFPDGVTPVEVDGTDKPGVSADRHVQRKLAPHRSILPKILRARLRRLLDRLALAEETLSNTRTELEEWGIEKNAELEGAYRNYLGMIMTAPDVAVPLMGDSPYALASDREVLGIEKQAGLTTLLIAPSLTIPLWLMARTASKNQEANAEQLALLAALAGARSKGPRVTVINPPPMPDLRPTALPYALLHSLANDPELREEGE